MSITDHWLTPPEIAEAFPEMGGVGPLLLSLRGGSMSRAIKLLLNRAREAALAEVGG